MEIMNSFDRYKSIVDEIEDKKEKLKLDERQLDWLMSLEIYDSLHIEGNTLTRSAITAFLDNGVTVHGKPFKEFLEVRNYEKAQGWLKARLLDDEFILNSIFIKTLHGIVARDTLEDCECGRYRDDQVYLKGASYLPPFWEDVPVLVDDLCEYYNNWLPDGMETRFENIIFTFRKLESVHPFFDGNGRTGRLLMNFLLLRNNYPFLWIKSELREEYLSCFGSKELCLEFHAHRAMETFEMIKKVRKTNK